MVTPDSEGSLPSPSLLRNPRWFLVNFVYQTFTVFGQSFQTVLLSTKNQCKVLQPPAKAGFGLFPFRSSLTQGISFDFYSCGYLDISVHRVIPAPPKGGTVSTYYCAWISPFGNRRIIAFWELPDDYRALSVLRRPNKPRHPLSALNYMIITFLNKTKLSWMLKIITKLICDALPKAGYFGLHDKNTFITWCQ